MAPVKCEVHQLGEGDLHKRVVRIRATAFQDKKDKFTVRITSTQSKSACFEAVYANDSYLKNRNLTSDNLVFMRKSWRILLDVKPTDQVEVEEIPENDSVYEVHSALSDDHNEGKFYIFDEQLHDKIKGKRRIARIRRRDRKDVKPVYSEALYADDFYLEEWQEIWKKRGTVPNFCKVIFISEWYRLLLGTNIGERIDLKVEPLDPGKREGLWPLLYLYPRDHPQAVVRTASILGFIGLGLGVISIGLGIFSIQSLFPNFILGIVIIYILSIVVGLLGLAIAFLGIIGLSLRR